MTLLEEKIKARWEARRAGLAPTTGHHDPPLVPGLRRPAVIPGCFVPPVTRPINSGANGATTAPPMHEALRDPRRWSRDEHALGVYSSFGPWACCESCRGRLIGFLCAACGAERFGTRRLNAEQVEKVLRSPPDVPCSCGSFRLNSVCDCTCLATDHAPSTDAAFESPPSEVGPSETPGATELDAVGGPQDEMDEDERMEHFMARLQAAEMGPEPSTGTTLEAPNVPDLGAAKPEDSVAREDEMTCFAAAFRAAQMANYPSGLPSVTHLVVGTAEEQMAQPPVMRPPVNLPPPLLCATCKKPRFGLGPKERLCRCGPPVWHSLVPPSAAAGESVKVSTRAPSTAAAVEVGKFPPTTPSADPHPSQGPAASNDLETVPAMVSEDNSTSAAVEFVHALEAGFDSYTQCAARIVLAGYLEQHAVLVGTADVQEGLRRKLNLSAGQAARMVRAGRAARTFFAREVDAIMDKILAREALDVALLGRLPNAAQLMAVARLAPRVTEDELRNIIEQVRGKKLSAAKMDRIGKELVSPSKGKNTPQTSDRNTSPKPKKRPADILDEVLATVTALASTYASRKMPTNIRTRTKAIITAAVGLM